MRKISTVLIAIASAAALLTITVCKELFADIEEDFSYWAAEPAITGFRSASPASVNAAGVHCVPSASPAVLTFTVRNPKNFSFIMPGTGAPSDIISFGSGISASTTDYTLVQSDRDTLTLTYTSAFLKRYEYGTGNIGAAIKLYSTDGRKFNQIYKFDLYANTAPALEYAEIGQTATADSDGNHYYVLIFRVKDMDNPITAGSIHKDIKKLIVTAGGVPSEIPLSFNTGKTDFTSSSADLLAATAVSQLDAAHPLPTDNWLLRLKTDVKIGGPEKVYDVSIKDTQGLSSEVIRASTQKTKLSDVELFDGLIGITGTTHINPKAFEGMSGKTLTAKAAPAGAAITGKVEKQNSYGSWTETDTVSGTTTAAINLPALGTGEIQVLYKISLKAQLSGYDDSNSKDFFVRLVRQEVPVLKLVQNFNGTPYEKNISTAANGYVTEDIIPDAENYNNSTNALVIYNSNNKAEFEIAPRAGSGAAVKYKLGGSTVVSPTTTPARIQLTGTGPHELEVWAVNGGWPGPHTTVHIKVVNAVSSYTQLKNVVQNAPAGNEIQINIGGNLTAPSGDTEIAVSDGKNLKLIPSTGGTIYTINANENGRIFKISGSGTVLNLEDIKLEGGNANTGGAVYVEAGGILKLTGKTVITPSTGGDTNTKGKNDVHLANGTSIKVDNALTTTEPIVARITPSYMDGSTVLTGSSASSEYTKFSVTQTDDGFLWKIKSDGTLQAIPTTINGGSGAWKRLKDAVQNLPEGSTITVNGTITATNDSGGDDRGVIDIDKNLTIQGKNGANSDILNANRDNLGSNARPIFRVSGGKTLTLKNLTLKGGKGISGTFGGAINVTGGLSKAELTDCIIEDCEADNGGAIGCGSGTTVKLKNTRIKKCKTTGSGSASGGGAIFASGATVEMTGCTLTNNEASVYGGGIYVTGGSLTLTNTTIGGEQFYDGIDPGKTKGNKAKSGGGVYIEGNGTSVTMNGGSIQYNKTIDGNGGGVYIKGDGTSFTMNGGKITQCKADVTSLSSNAGRGGGIYGDNTSSPINITIKGTAEISYNESTCQGTGSGGGIYGGTNSIITVSENATIKNNSAKGYGGGVYFKSTFIFTGGTITENTITFGADKSGAGIFSGNSSTTLEMSGNARVANDNDIYLPNSKVVTITGSLSQNPAARITPETYGTTTQVLTAGSGVTLADEAYKFAVTPKIVSGTPQPWTVGGNGKLKQGRYTEVPYGQLANYLANNASATEVNYIEVTGISAAAFVGTYGSPPNPGALGQKIKNNPSKKVALKLPSGLSGIDMSACFAQCGNLVSLENLPSGVTNMRACFYDCQGLTTVPAMLIGSGSLNMELCFYNCKNLVTAPDIPAGVFAISKCFQNCKKLQSVKMHCPYNSGIGNFNGAFSGCDLPDGGIKVPLLQLATYKANAGTMGTTKEKFSAIP